MSEQKDQNDAAYGGSALTALEACPYCGSVAEYHEIEAAICCVNCPVCVTDSRLDYRALAMVWNCLPRFGEPIAWMVVNDGGQDAFVTADPAIAGDGQRALPLHTGIRSNAQGKQPATTNHTKDENNG